MSVTVNLEQFVGKIAVVAAETNTGRSPVFKGLVADHEEGNYLVIRYLNKRTIQYVRVAMRFITEFESFSGRIPENLFAGIPAGFTGEHIGSVSID